MLGKFFKKAKETVSGISDAVRGVEHVDWITHAFPYSLEMLMDVDEARDLSRPRPPAGLDPAAVARCLGEADLWPTHLSLRRSSLESVFLELTADEGLTTTQGRAA